MKLIANDFLLLIMINPYLKLKEKKKLSLFLSHKFKLNILTTKDVSKKYVSWLNSYDITKYTEQSKNKHTNSSVREFVFKKYKSKYNFLFGIYANDNHVGNIKLGTIKWDHFVSDISFFIGDRNYWGKGIATAAVKKVVNFGFNKLKLNKVNAGYYENNLSSAKVFKKSGFSIEGVRKNNIIFEGRKINSVLVGISK